MKEGGIKVYRTDIVLMVCMSNQKPHTQNKGNSM